MRNRFYIVIYIFIVGCSSAPKEPENISEQKREPFYKGTIITRGEIISPLSTKTFEKQYHFSETQYKYEYKDNNKISGLIVNYKTLELTFYASEDTLKRKFTTTIKEFEKSFEKLDFFKDCVDRLFTRIYLPTFIGKISNYGNIKDADFDLLKYKDNKGRLEIFDLKINIPDFVKEVSFIQLPGEVKFFPLINIYHRELNLWEKILLKTSKINITSTEIIELSKDISFTLPEEYKNVVKISYSLYDEPSKGERKRSKSLFDEFDD